MTLAMQCIVPLAGPDFVRPDGTLKPLCLVDGEPLLFRVLSSRRWHAHLKTSSGLVFVVRDLPETPAFCALVQDRYPHARFVTVSGLTNGALLSAAAGAALLHDYSVPLCVDLVDILYDVAQDPLRSFDDPNCLGALPYFESTDPSYSYLVLEGGVLKATAEKRVLSSHASAGTYFFRDVPTFLQAVASSTRNAPAWAHRGALFICPAYNALVDRGHVIGLVSANVFPLSKYFHT
jgi:hypothetical protein